MTKGNCAVHGCSNSSYRLKKWKKENCLLHKIPQGECECQPQFSLHYFPSELRNGEWRQRWVQAMKRETEGKKKWLPGVDDRVCSEHFIDGMPTLENPDPTLKLGYDVPPKKERRPLKRNEGFPVTRNVKKRKNNNNSKVSAKKTLHDEYGTDLNEGFDTGMDENVPNEHSYCKVDKSNDCATCADQSEVIKSLVNKVNKLTISLRKNTFGGNVTGFTFKKIKTDKKMTFYTGLTSIGQFDAVFMLLKPYLSHVRYWRGAKRIVRSKVRRYNYRRTRKLSQKDEFLLTLMRLRLGLLNEDLADRFCISPSMVSNIFSTWIPILSRVLGDALVCWIPREAIRTKMPQSFKKMGYTNCRVILDCSEVFIERPKSLNAQAVTWSDYKHHNTLKFLVGIAPTGYITFLSNTYGGRASDRHIVLDSNFLDILERGDQVMADRGFQIKEDLLLKFCSLVVPPGARIKSQFTEKEVKKTKEIANLRIHVERAINRMKTFRLLKTILPITILHLADGIVKTCAALANLKDLLIR